jgi:ribosomal-protein-serine acetyltransferase
VIDSPRPLTTRLDGPVTLRRFSADGDAEAFAEHVVRGGERLRAYLPWPDATRTPDGAQAWLGAYERGRDGRVVAVGAWCGEVLTGGGVLMHHDPEAASVELGVWVVGEAAGAGVAGAICRVLLAEARDELAVHRVSWQCASGNDASLRLAGRLGFRHEGTLRGAYVLRGERRDLHVLGLVGDEIDAAVAPRPR